MSNYSPNSQHLESSLYGESIPNTDGVLVGYNPSKEYSRGNGRFAKIKELGSGIGHFLYNPEVEGQIPKDIKQKLTDKLNLIRGYGMGESSKEKKDGSGHYKLAAALGAIIVSGVGEYLLYYFVLGKGMEYTRAFKPEMLTPLIFLLPAGALIGCGIEYVRQKRVNKN